MSFDFLRLFQSSGISNTCTMYISSEFKEATISQLRLEADNKLPPHDKVDTIKYTYKRNLLNK